MFLNAKTVLSGRYEIQEKIGSGGMAVVYRGRDLKLDRNVTVKVLKEEFTHEDDFKNRFTTEARSAARLSHQNIVNVYDVGEDNGIYYIVMEYIHGDTLKEIIREKAPLDEVATLSIAIQMVSALDNAHKNGVVHRDIKPENILISVDGTIKITDFGIARAADVSTVTVTTNAVGSVYYFSPEQARGGYVDEKSDIYSAGITIYEMLTGHVPFEGNNSVAIALKHLNSDIPDIKQYNPNVSDELISIVKKATAKKKDDRYNSSYDMLSDLKLALAEKTAFRKNKSNEKIENKENETQNNIININVMEDIGGEPEPEEIIKVEISGGKNRNKPYDNLSKIDDYISKDDDYETDDYEDEYYEDDYEDEIDYSPKRTNQKEVVKQLKQSDRTRNDDYYDEDEYYRKKERKTIIAAVITALIIIGVISFFGAKFLSGQGVINNDEPQSSAGLNDNENKNEVEVPNFMGYTIDKAKKEAEEAGININVAKSEYSDYDENTIINQSPEGGETVLEGQTVDVVVSLGQKSFTMPNVVNDEKDEAISKIEDVSGQKPDVEYEFDDTVKAGLVIAQSPEPQTQMKAGDSILLTISKGKEDTSVVVPNFVGKDISDVKNELESVGLKLGSISSVESDKPKDQVISQSLSKGSEAEQNSSINFEVSKGKTEQEPDENNEANENNTQQNEQEKTLAFSVSAPSTYTDIENIPVKILKIVNGSSVEVAYDDKRPLSDFPFMVNISGSGTAEVQCYIDNVYQWSETVDFSEGN